MCDKTENQVETGDAMCFSTVGGKPEPSPLVWPHRVNIIIDGQFGSTGKGLFAGFIAKRHDIDLAVTNAAPNAGHTYIDGDLKIVAYHLPIAGILCDKARIYLCAGAIIDPDLLIDEIKRHRIPQDRIVVHPRAAWLQPHHTRAEQGDGSAQTKLGSTRKGVGSALAGKVLRSESTIDKCTELFPYVTFGDLRESIVRGHYRNILMEVPQGMDLGLNYGLSYPHCTSREVSVSQALSDLGVHPSMLGAVTTTMRTYPIRVGHIVDPEGSILGDSGPCYPDQKEIEWSDIGVKPELTTVTKRVRRVFTFSEMQMRKAIEMHRPDVIFLNFANYCPDRMQYLVNRIRAHSEYSQIFVGAGPDVKDVYSWKGDVTWPTSPTLSVR
jgi:adenylosuccinate synthase